MDNMAFIRCFHHFYYVSFRETPAVCPARLHMPEQIHWKTVTKRNGAEQKQLNITAWQGGSYYIPLFFLSQLDYVFFSVFFFTLSFTRTHYLTLNLCVITKSTCASAYFFFSVDFFWFSFYFLSLHFNKKKAVYLHSRCQ